MDNKGYHLIDWLFDDYLAIVLSTLGVSACVCLSYYLSRFIPVELFDSTISPILHLSMLVVAIAGAIAMHFCKSGIRARGAWQVSLILFAIVEVSMWITERVFGVPTLIFGVQTLLPQDMLIRDILAIILLAYPAEILCPRWLTPIRGTLLFSVPFILFGLNHWLAVDLRILLILYPLFICLVLVSRIPAYKERCEANFSSLENSGMRWIWIYIITLMISGLSYFYLCFSNHPTRLFTQQWLVLFLLTYNTIQIIARRSPWLDTDLQGMADDEEQAATDEPSPFPPEYRASFEAWMKAEKPYLNKDFRLADLMQVLPLNRTYLSRFLKTEYGCNFYQLVTNYRIKEAQTIIRDNPEIKMWEVAELSGFTSAIVFNRAFKREIGLTPTEWQQTCNNT